MLYSILIVILALLIRRLCTLNTSVGRLWLSAARTEALFHSTLLVTGVHFSRTRLKKDELREEGFLIQRHRSFRTASSTSKQARITPPRCQQATLSHTRNGMFCNLTQRDAEAA